MIIEKPYKIYLAKLKRPEYVPGLPNTVYKVGITSSADAMDRLTYESSDESNPITSVFSDIKVMKTVWVRGKEKAEEIESSIMKYIQGSEKSFHNWYEPRQISGITEMRKWNYDEVQTIFGMFDHLVKNNHAAATYRELEYV